MTVEAFEQGNRRAEIDGNLVTFQLVSGRVRKSTRGVWKIAVDDLTHARRLAKRWVLKGKLGKPVLG